jgi:hypothetical protein
LNLVVLQHCFGNFKPHFYMFRWAVHFWINKPHCAKYQMCKKVLEWTLTKHRQVGNSLLT